MSDNDFTGDEVPLSLDVFLRDVLPEIKLALGEQIDRENARALPSRYARLLPETLLVVVLRADAAEAILPVAAEIERELTDSCSRHGSLYDRVYQVQLRRAEAEAAPLFAVVAHSGLEAARPASQGVPIPGDASPAVPDSGSRSADGVIPVADPDATQAEGLEPPQGWIPGRWLLIVEDEKGEEREVFRLTEPFTTVGRRSDDPQLRVTVALGSAPNVSRRQLALLWDGEEPEPGFRLFNLGLNPLRVGSLEVPGARLGRGELRLESLDSVHVVRVGPGSSIRIGEHGPTLRLHEVAAIAEDPDATVYD
jgi:hypothetical protein